MRRIVVLLVGVGLLGATTPASALITAPTPLSGQLNENQYIFTVQVERIDPDKPGMILSVDEVLKGKPPFQKLAVNLSGDGDSQTKKETPLLLKRVAPKLPLLLFVKQNDKNFTAFAYSNGTWFQMAGVRTDDDDVLRLPFTHLEPYLRRTYKGTTAEMKQVVVDGLAGKKDPPDPNLKEKPGLGPEVEAPDKPKEKDKEGSVNDVSGVSRGPVFGVIPMLVVGPLALLAMLFPAVFGGLMLVLKRWTTALTVLSVGSLLLFFQDLFHDSLAASWPWAATPEALWLTLSLATVCGVGWAWRKHAARLVPPPLPVSSPVAYAPGSVASTQFTWSRPMARTVEFFPPPAPARFEPPQRGEMIALAVLGLCCLATSVFLLLPLARSRTAVNPREMSVALFAVMSTLAILAATLHACFLSWVVARRRAPRPGLPGEGVLLGSMLLLCVAFAFTTTNESQAAAPTVQMASGGQGARSFLARDLFKPAAPSWIASSPLVVGDRVYVGAVHGQAYQSGSLYCLNRESGDVLWNFDDGGTMKNVFSSPCVAGNRVFVGEGFHQHSKCRLFCLDADKGKKLWEFPTESHTESSPCVVDGKVYFGAGDDGLFCVKASDGGLVWHEARGLHVDASPLVVGGRVYCGSGVGDAYQKTCVFCLDAATGQEVWRVPTDLPVWGESALSGGRLFVGLGNGNFMESDEKPGGAVWCLDAVTGERLWKYDVPDGVHVRVAVDADRVYFGARDQNSYCLDHDGKLLWKRDLGSPVVASPVLVRLTSSPEPVRCPESGCSVGLYMIGNEGQAYCLDPATGEVEWTLDLGKGQKNPTFFSSPTVVVSRDADGNRRRVYFGSGFNFFGRGTLYCVEDVMGRPIVGK